MTSELETLIVARAYKPEDKNFIMATFLRGMYYDNKFFGMMPKDEFMLNYKPVVEALIDKSDVRVACLKEDPDVITGYFLGNSNAIHWCYTKAAWRKRGIMRLLLPKTINVYTHFSSLGLILKDKIPNITFNPFKLTP